MTIARWPVDCYTGIHELLAALINVVDMIGEVAKVAAFAVFLGVPVVGEFYLRFFIAGCGKKNQRKSALLALVTPDLSQSKLVAVKIE